MLGRSDLLAFALASFCFVANPLSAEEFPTQPVVIIVPSTPGGGTDIISRVIGDRLSKQLRQPLVVQNVLGAGSAVGTAAGAKARPDGYTLVAGLTSSMAVNPSLFSNLAYDPIRDFEPVAMLARYPFVLVVSKNFAAHSVSQLIALAKSRPGEINYASAGNGSGQHLSAELFKLATSTNLTHVPYRGAQPAYTDVIAGQVPVFFDNVASAVGQIEGGTVRSLAVTGSERSPQLPDVPTFAEAGVPGYENHVWFGFWVPKRVPQTILDKLNAEVTKALADPTVRERIRATAGEPFDMPRDKIETFVKAEIAKWADVVKRAGIAVQ